MVNSTFPNRNSTGLVIDYGEVVPNFELANGAGNITLYNSSGSKINNISYSLALDSVSMGRYPDGSETITSFNVLTPGDKNDNAAPVLNKWANPATNNSFIKGLVNVTINITDAAHAVNVSLLNFNNSNFTMNRSGDLFYFLWNTSQNAENLYNITIFFNDSLGFSNTDTLLNITADNTNPNITAPATSANSRNFVNPGFLFNASANATDTNILNVTCSLASTTVGNFTSSGKTHTCNLTAPSAEGDFDVIFTAIDRAGNTNTTNIISF